MLLHMHVWNQSQVQVTSGSQVSHGTGVHPFSEPGWSSGPPGPPSVRVAGMDLTLQQGPFPPPPLPPRALPLALPLILL